MKQPVNNKEKWIHAGYRQFGQIGPESLKVERLSTIVGLNRSSFYHYFGDTEVFETQLLKYHIDLFRLLGMDVGRCQYFSPDVIKVVNSHKPEISFHRQLLIHESVTRYKLSFDAAKAFTEILIFELWRKHLAVNSNRDKEYSLFQTIRDFYLLHYKQANEKEVYAILEDIKVLMNNLNPSSK